jgi:WD40 repeat protein
MSYSGNDSHVVVWSLASGEMVQELCIPSAGYISCLAWLKLGDHDEDSFVFGASDGNIHLFQCSKDSPPFFFVSITAAHAGAIESLTWDSHHRRLASVGARELCVWNVALDLSKFLNVFHTSLIRKLYPTEFFLPTNKIVAKQPYVARSVHFLDDGNSVLVCYLESGQVYI